MKTYPSFFNYFSTTSFAIALKVSLVEEEEFFCSLKVSKFLHAASFANARKVDVSEFKVKNWGSLRLRHQKNDLLIFLTNKRHLAGTIDIRFLIYLTAIYEQNMKLNCHEIKILVDFSWPSLLNTNKCIFSVKSNFIFCPFLHLLVHII